MDKEPLSYRFRINDKELTRTQVDNRIMKLYGTLQGIITEIRINTSEVF